MDNQTTTFRTHLKRVLRQWRIIIALQGLAMAILVGVLLVGLSMGLDYMIGLDSLVRTGLLLLCVVGVVTMIVRYVIQPLRSTPDDIQVARYIEERHPELKDGFVSAVEFEGKQLDGTAKVFLDRLLRNVSVQSGEINFSRVIEPQRVKRAVGLTVLAAALLTILAVQDVELFGRTATRLATPWERPGPLLSTELVVTPGDTRVQRGGNQPVTVELLGQLTSSVRLLSKTEEQEEWYPVEMFETDSTGIFTFEMTSIAEHTEYYVDASPARSETYLITVFDPPHVEQIDVNYRYPSYTGLSRKTEEDKGDITAPIGTTVTLTITANKAIKTGNLNFSNGRTQDLKVDDRTLTGAFKVSEDLSYLIKLVDTDDLTNSDPVEYYIRAIPDNLPRVTITNPGRDTQVSPIEELNIRVEAEDDFGLSSFSLIYSVNGDEEQVIDLAAADKDQSRTLWDGEHNLYLEELSVEPGDFISYYASASDRRGEDGTTSTDMFFVTIKPFEEIYRQGGGGGGGGGGVAGVQPGRLSQEQKEIIAATWRVDRDRKRNSEKQTTDDLNAIADAQDGLLTRVDEGISMMTFQGGMDPEMQEMIDLLQKSKDPMERASTQLRAGSSKEALPPEREALQYLLKLDSLIREFMVTMAQNQNQGGGAPLDISDTSELELKRDENKYETLDQSNQTQQQSQTVDESSQRVKELARRQQQLNEQMRQLGNQNDRRSEAERQRELDRLTREQRQLRQQAEEMARQLSQMQQQQQQQQQSSQGQPQSSQGQQSSQAMNQSLQQASQSLRESSEGMGQSAQQMQRGNPQQASGQGSQALQRLQDANQQLARAQGNSLEQMVRDAVRQADELATRQEQLARAVEELKKEKDRDYAGIKARVEALDNGRGGLTESDKEKRVEQFVRKRLEDVGEAKDQTRQDLERLKDDLQFLSGQAGTDQPLTQEALNEALKEIDNRGLDAKMERSKRFLQPDAIDRSVKTEKDLTGELQKLAEQIRTAQDKFIVPDQDQLARAQDQTREALSDMQNLERQLERMRRRPLPGMDQALSQDYQEQMQDMQNLADQLPQNSQQGQQLRNQLNQASQLGNEPWKIDRADWRELRSNIARTLIDIHKELNDRLQSVDKQDKLFMAREENVPSEYRDLVNKYYEKLSKDVQE